MKHAFDPACSCRRCSREGDRRARQATRTEARERCTMTTMIDWRGSRNPRRARVAQEYWDAFESGRPMSDDDR